jgi:hypothetical protein
MEGTSRIGPLVGNEPSHRFHDRLERWAQEHGLRRLFWLSLGVFVAGEGVIGFLAILFSGFPADVELSRTLLSAILCVTTALCGLALISRRWLSGYAETTVVGAGLALPLLVAFIWVPGSGAWSDLHWSAVAVLVGVLASSAQRLWLGDWTRAVLKRIVFVVTASSIGIIVPLAIAAIWGWTAAAEGRALSAFSLLAFVGFLLTPILRRVMRKAASSGSDREN